MPEIDYGPTAENFLASFPIALQHTPSIQALAETAARALAAIALDLPALTIYPNIDALPDDLLDILAHDYKVDWWDPDYSLDQKRRTLKESWMVHKRLGTKAAVVAALSAIYPNTTIEEWWEYEGKPYHFRIHIGLTTTGEFDPVKHRRVITRVRHYKPLRCTMDALEYRFPVMPIPEVPGLFLFLRLRIPLRVPNHALLPRSALPNLRLSLPPIPVDLSRLCHLTDLTLAGFKTRTKDRLSTGIRFSLHVPNHHVHVLLDGKHTLDGSWLLFQALPGIALPNLRFSPFPVPVSLSRLCHFHGWTLAGCKAGTENRARTPVLALACPVRSPSAAPLKALRLSLACQNPAGSLTGVTLVQDSLWHLDGHFSLNGSRSLHAEIITESLRPK